MCTVVRVLKNALFLRSQLLLKYLRVKYKVSFCCESISGLINKYASWIVHLSVSSFTVFRFDHSSMNYINLFYWPFSHIFLVVWVEGKKEEERFSVCYSYCEKCISFTLAGDQSRLKTVRVVLINM